MATAVTKALVETPALVALEAGAPSPIAEDPDWTELAEHVREDARLDEGGRAMVRRHLAPEFVYPDGSVDEAGFAATIDGFERLMALDTVRNQAVYRPAVERLIAADPDATFEELNARVYATVFRMLPDPW